MSLSDELQAQAAVKPRTQQSQIDLFLETLSKKDQADVEAWVATGKNRKALYLVLKRRGLPVAESTLRNWAASKCL